MTSVAVLGAGGTMGGGMGLNLLEIGFEVRAWNRSADKLGPVIDEGATACETPAKRPTGPTSSSRSSAMPTRFPR